MVVVVVDAEEVAVEEAVEEAVEDAVAQEGRVRAAAAVVVVLPGEYRVCSIS